MRRWVLLIGLVLALLLAACDGGDDETPQDEVVEPEATEVLQEAVDLLPIEPGLKMQTGLTMLNHSLGKRGDIGYFYGEVRNDTGKQLHAIESFVYAVDELGYEIGIHVADSLMTEIPPGQVFYVGRDFTTSEDFADAQIWVRYLEGEAVVDGFFNLPATVEYHGLAENMEYVVRGTVQNTSGQTLNYYVVDVVLIGPDENLVGLSRGVLTLSAADGSWQPGENAAFEAPFFFTAVEPDLVQDVRVAAAGYAQRQ